MKVQSSIKSTALWSHLKMQWYKGHHLSEEENGNKMTTELVRAFKLQAGLVRHRIWHLMPLFVKCLTFMITEVTQIGSKAFCPSGKACALLKPAWLSLFASWVPGRCECRVVCVLHEHLQHPWDRLPPGSWKSYLIHLFLSFHPQKMDHLFCVQALHDTYHIALKSQVFILPGALRSHCKKNKVQHSFLCWKAMDYSRLGGNNLF